MSSGVVSAGILLYRRTSGGLEVLLGHPGGPLWRSKDAGSWSIPKGEAGHGEDLRAVALREFEEETGHEVEDPDLTELGSVVQRSGKVVHAWACEGNLDPARAVSNTFTLEWPPRSGRYEEHPELDRVEWFTLDEARHRINPSQQPFLDRLAGLAG